MKSSQEKTQSYRVANFGQGWPFECHSNVIPYAGMILATVVIATGCGPAKDLAESGMEAACSATEATTTWTSGSLRHERPDCATVELSATVLGTGEFSVDFVEEAGGWQPTVTATSAGRFEGLVLSGAYSIVGTVDPVLWRQGYQSWSYSGVTALEALERDDRGVPLIGGDGDAIAVKDEGAGTSWWVGLVGRTDGGSLLLGAIGALKTRFFVAVDGGELWAVWGHRGDSIALEDGETLELDPIFLGSGSDPTALHEAYAGAATERVPARDLGERPPTGWATWYHFFEDITEDDVRSNLVFAEGLEAVDVDASLEVFQIDDGWQHLWGDWQAGAEFPSGMPALADDIAAAGFTPGLWMAPFYVSRETEIYQANPDWWVREPDGEDEIGFSNLATGDYAILDVTHPDAADWLSAEIESKVEEGWTYLKLDFLYAGAEVGRRHADITAIEAYHVGMQIIREAAGDAWILACGAPFLPSLGYAESFRTGADIAFGFDRDPKLAYLRWATRSTAARSWSNGRWWWIDPDQLLVRPPFTDAEAAGAVVANAVSGGTWMLGDDLPALTDARLSLAMNPLLMSLRGQAARPRDPLAAVSGVDPGPPFEDAIPNDMVPIVWDFEDGKMALLNLSDESVEVDISGGEELISGLTSGPTLRVLAPGAGEIWLVD